MLARAIPWMRSTGKADAESLRLREETAAITAEAEALAPAIKAQSEFLVERGEINGFTHQLRAGFARKLAGE